MQATHPLRTALTALALVMVASTCGSEADETPLSRDDPAPSAPATADILVEVVRADGAPVVAADVVINLIDGTRFQAVTDGGGRVWADLPPDWIASIVATKDASSFEAMTGAVVYERVTDGEPVTLVLERDVPVTHLSVRGEVLGLADPTDQVMITATSVAHVTWRPSTPVFALQLFEPDPFVLLGVEWRRGLDASARKVDRDLVAFAHADSGRPVVDGMWLDLDFGPDDNVAPEPGEPMPWTRSEISGSFSAPRDELLADHGRADLSIHFLGAQGHGYLGGATHTEPTADGYRYEVRYEAPLPGAVETLVTVTASGAQSGAWLLGPPPSERFELDLLSPPAVVVNGEDAHHAIAWALGPNEDHDQTVLHFRRDGRLLGRMIVPAYLRWTTLPVMPTAQAEMELMDGPIELVVEICDTDPLQSRCERYARSAPATVTACALPFCNEP